ncbi:unnamed protein product [Dovyalis caffra]|uniref:DUF4057 domain-containing protein n=1 Tax=Dovyalis caffra TaxID=77055 RepID=A0AAV1SK50_9ROSI|nr:unnamed protein product [Dovyalis caffra]
MLSHYLLTWSETLPADSPTVGSALRSTRSHQPSDGISKIMRISPIGDGCINTARRCDADAGSFFVKINRGIGPSMFEGEALGLGAMAFRGNRCVLGRKLAEMHKAGKSEKCFGLMLIIPLADKYLDIRPDRVLQKPQIGLPT